MQEAYSEPVSKPAKREGRSRKAIHCKNNMGCMAGLTVTFICVAATGLLVVIQGEV